MEQFGTIFPRNSVLIPRPINIYIHSGHTGRYLYPYPEKMKNFPKNILAKKYEKIFLFSILIGLLHR
jgi:hypothetical protein